MREYTEMAGKMSAKILTVPTTGKEKCLLKEGAKVINSGITLQLPCDKKIKL